MNEFTYTVILKVKVKTDLPSDAAMQELETESHYDFPSTDNVEVVSTEWFSTHVKESFT